MIELDRIITKILQNENKYVIRFFSIIRQLSNPYAFVFLGIYLIVAGIKNLGLTLFIWISSWLLVEFGLKNLIKRKRPGDAPSLVADNNEGRSVFVKLINRVFHKGQGYSFPSSHSFNVGIAVVMSVAYIDNLILKSMSVLLFALIALSRVVLKHHYFLDVVSGCILGVLVGVAII